MITTIAVYFLIFVGGIVRNTGSGMGCPDWPKCFGSYVPPLSDDKLPEDYQNFYLDKRLAKTDRLVKMLNRIGMTETARKIAEDPYLEEEDRFDVKTAWIEYINRLIGVLIGFLVLLTTVRSFSYWSKKRKVTFIALFGMVLILFQGWFGSLVVATNLIPAFVSVHMILAFIQILVLLYLFFLSRPETRNNVDLLWINKWYLMLFVLFIPQVLLGTQVRHIVDLAVFEGFTKEDWLLGIDWKFYVHRSYSIIFLVVSAILYWKVRSVDRESAVYQLTKWTFGLIAFESISGATMYYFDFPFGIQPLHLLIASVIFGLLFYLTLVSRPHVTK